MTDEELLELVEKALDGPDDIDRFTDTLAAGLQVPKEVLFGTQDELRSEMDKKLKEQDLSTYVRNLNEKLQELIDAKKRRGR